LKGSRNAGLVARFRHRVDGSARSVRFVRLTPDFIARLSETPMIRKATVSGSVRVGDAKSAEPARNYSRVG